MDQRKPNNTRTKIFDELMLFFEHIMVPYLDERFGGVETRLGGVETRLGGVETRLDKVESRLGGVESRLDKVESRLGGVEEDLDEVKTDLKIVKRGIEILQKTTPNKFDFNDHEKRITRLEKVTFPTSN